MADRPNEILPHTHTALPLSRVSTIAGYGLGKTAIKASWPIVRASADVIYRIAMELVARPSLAGLRGAGNLVVGVGLQFPAYLIYNLLGRLPYYTLGRPALSLARNVLPKRGEALTALMQRLDERYTSFKEYWHDTRVYKGWQNAKQHMSVKSLEHFIHDFFDARMEGVFKWGNSLSPNKALLTLVVCFGVLAPLSPAMGLLLHGYSFPWFMPDWLAAGAHAAIPMLKAAGMGVYHYGQALMAAPLSTVAGTLQSGLTFLQTTLPSLGAAAQSFATNFAAAPAQTLLSVLPSLATVKLVAFEAVKLPVLMAGFVATNVAATFFPKAKLLLPAVFAACANQASKSPFGGRQLAAWLNHAHKLDVVKDIKNDAAFAERNIVKPWTNHTLFGLTTLGTALMAPSFVWVPVAGYIGLKGVQKFVAEPIAATTTWQDVSAATRNAAASLSGTIVSSLERIPLLGRGVAYAKQRAISIANDKNVVDKLSGTLAPFAEKSSSQYWSRRLGTTDAAAVTLVPQIPAAEPRADKPAVTEQNPTAKSLLETLIVYGTSATAPLLTVLAAQTAFKVDHALGHALSFMTGGHEVAALFSGILAATVGVATFVSTTSVANKLPNWLFRPAAAEATTNPDKIDNAKGALIIEGVVMGTLGLAACALGVPAPVAVAAAASWAVPTLLKGRQQIVQAYAPTRSEPKQVRMSASVPAQN